MRWYPWRWFSDLVLVGSGGFSAVYGANISLLYDVSETGQQFGVQRRPVAIKVVDEKILNEVCMICIWELKKNMFVLGGGRGKERLRNMIYMGSFFFKKKVYVVMMLYMYILENHFIYKISLTLVF